MICLYNRDETDFNHNGTVLIPTVCTVHEVAGGAYELHMEHPMDEDYERFLLIETDKIIKANVPPLSVPEITLPVTKVWRAKRNTPLYSVLPRYTKPTGQSTDLAAVRAHPENYAWTVGRQFLKGAYCVHNSVIWRCQMSHIVTLTSPEPGKNSSVWSYVEMIISGNDLVNNASSNGLIPGTIIRNISENEQVTFVANYNATYIQVRDHTANANVGYVARDDLEETNTEDSGEVIPAHEITEQLFRIYDVQCEDDTGMVIVEARHISYDFAGNGLFDCKLKEATPADALARIRGALIEPDDRRLACDIVTDTKINQDWSGKNPINALLGQDSGLVPLVDARLIRDNNDFYILDNSNPNQGIILEYGANLIGVHWGQNTENVITRIVPRCKNGKEGYLYLDNLFVDSPKINQYPFHRIEILECDCTVGSEQEKIDGTKEKWTEETAKQEMLKRAQDRFSKEHADDVAVTLEVEFLLIGDTEAYKQYRGLQRVNLYDEMIVKAEHSGIYSEAQMTEYEYDCLNERYNSICIGKVNGFKRIPARRIGSYSIDYGKLAPEVVEIIENGNDSDDDNYYGNGTGNDDVTGGGGYVLPLADDGIRGGVQIGYTQNGKNYPVQLSNEKMYVNVPWSNTTYSAGTGLSLSNNEFSVKLGYTNSGKNYKVQADNSGNLYVNVPWTDTTYSLPLAANGTRGGIQIGYTQSGKNYPVQLSSEKAYVNVPWENTTYTAGTGLSLSSGAFSVKLGYTNSGKNYKVQADSSGNLYVNVPWSDTTYSLPLAANGTRGGIQIGYTQSGKNYPVQLSSEKAYVNVPWENTTYTAGTGLSLSSGAFSVKLGYTTSGKNYKVQADSSGNLYVNVPWTDTSYSLPLAASGTRGGVQIGYGTAYPNYAVQLSGEKMYVNVPWTDHQYTAGANGGLALSNGAFSISSRLCHAYEISANATQAIPGELTNGRTLFVVANTTGIGMALKSGGTVYGATDLNAATGATITSTNGSISIKAPNKSTYVAIYPATIIPVTPT